MRQVLIAFVTFLATLAASLPVGAQDEVDNARRHYEAGRSYYVQLRYADAAREFEEAYRLSGRPHLLKNVAVSHQHAESWDEAVAAFERYLEEAPRADDREEIEARLATLRELAASGAESDMELEAGDADRDLAQAPLDAGPAEGGGFPTAAVVTLGAGVAFGIASLITGLMAHSVYQDLDASCRMGSCLPAQETDRNRGQTLAVTSTILMAVAGTAGVVAVILFLVGDTDGDSSESVARLGPGPGEIGASMAVTF